MSIKIGLIGGTGLGSALATRESGVPMFIDTPFGKPSSTIFETLWHGLPVLVLPRHGKGHIHSPTHVNYRANIFALKMLGCTHILASGAVGSLREEFRPRDLVIPDQVIDKTNFREATFFEKAAVHVEFAEPFCPVLRELIRGTAITMQTEHRTHFGACYVAMEGPAFSTRAESMMHRIWGGDLIGMTAMPEAKLAREAEIPYALIALVTDYDSWRVPPKAKEGELPKANDPHALLNEIIFNLKMASDNAIALIKLVVERIAQNPSLLDSCPATNALERAIWSDKSQIDQEEINRLSPLWGRYFS
ncbi:MAG TPA: MTAP family purine nucleoside phosphorylase [Tepidisphaeraceae bacterium]|nr:MTAP family purine nucleoside phosphorylase [Tepidisphaeraceae bacterium]